MANEINGVNGIQQTQFDQTKQIDVTKQDASKVNIKFPKNGEPEKTQEFNVYGKDITNFEKFKGNDKNDAMRMTQTAANDVKKAYMQLQHEFPTVVLQFEPMPDPKKSGKKREGFFNYQQQLEDWKDFALTQIANAREKSTEEIAGNIIMNDNRNAAINAGITLATGEAIINNDNINAEEINDNVDREGAATRKAVHSEGAATRRAVHNEGAATREAVHNEGAATRNTVRFEGFKTRNTIHEEATETKNVVRQQGAETRNEVRENAKETQELESLSSKISDVLTNGYQPHTTETVKTVENMRDNIMQSNLPHNKKKELLNDLANFSDQIVLSDRELERKRKEINLELSADLGKETENAENEFPKQEPEPFYEIPEFKSEKLKKTNNLKESQQPESTKESSVEKKNFNELFDKFKK